MKKFLLLFLLLLLIFQQKVYSYSAYDGRYSYSDISESAVYPYSSADSDDEILFIVDFSGSMNEELGGSTRIKHAMEAVKNLLITSDASGKIGLRIFGIPDGSVIERTASGYEYNVQKLCRSSRLVMPPARWNRAGIIDKLENALPLGVTPIHYALQQAVQNDFTNDENVNKHIILVTDGAENCGGDPCRYIREIMSVRRDYTIDVIGISIDKNDYSMLSCIADAGNGTFYQVNTPEDFKSAFLKAYNSYKQPESPHSADKRGFSAENSAVEYKHAAFQFDY